MKDRLPALGRLAAFSLLFVVLAGFILANAPANLLAQGMGMVLACLVASGVMLRAEGQSVGSLGFSMSTLDLRNLPLGFLLGVGIALPAILLAAVGGLRWMPDAGTWIEYGATAGWTAFVLLLPAAGEELLFRGYPMRVLLREWGPLVALIVTSVAFALLHGWNPEVGPVGLVNIALAGALLGVIYLKTGSLWWATGAHAGWNFATGFAADLPVSGTRVVNAPLVEPAQSGAPWMTGGAFGLEGGVAATMALALGTGVLLKSRFPRPSVAALSRGSLAPLA